MPNRIVMFHMPCSISGPMPTSTNSFKHAVLGWQSCVDDFIDCYRLLNQSVIMRSLLKQNWLTDRHFQKLI
ncbi:hypothetical protein T12_819 [Trichinella patagoniensis]|uniref:Uncharacterized protein n=1 Tax=Trichinella patagoniensis TaxID=990121 RepID=A0A0V1AFK3_9BILA|nr:hypothetical protein T12_819 [Trichinella patagoniensis]